MTTWFCYLLSKLPASAFSKPLKLSIKSAPNFPTIQKAFLPSLPSQLSIYLVKGCWNICFFIFRNIQMYTHISGWQYWLSITEWFYHTVLIVFWVQLINHFLDIIPYFLQCLSFLDVDSNIKYAENCWNAESCSVSSGWTSKHSFHSTRVGAWCQ